MDFVNTVVAQALAAGHNVGSAVEAAILQSMYDGVVAGKESHGCKNGGAPLPPVTAQKSGFSQSL